MIAQQRKNLILERLTLDGQIVAKTLAKELGLSEDTIRRDLRELARDGLLQRVHGGALPISSAIADFSVRQDIEAQSKIAIAKAAANLIEENQIVILDGGTTSAQLARHIPKTLKATIITHSPSIALELMYHSNIEVIMLGGVLFKHSMVNMGNATLDALSHIRADTYFMGVTGVHAEVGLSTGNFEEAHMKKALSEHAAETFVMASNEKLGVASSYVIMPINDINMLLIDKGHSQKALKPYAQLDVTLIEV